MPTMPLEDHEFNQRFGAAAWSRIRDGRTSADPSIYAVWYAFERRTHHALVADLNDRLLHGVPSDAELIELHDRHLGPTLGRPVEALAASAHREVTNVLALVREHLDGLSGSSRDLTRALSSIADAGISGAEIATALNAVVLTWSRMVEANRELEAKLARSEQNIVMLKADLDTARIATTIDGLTGLFNRSAFDAQLASALEPMGATLCLAMIDIDNFKGFNDRHGHQIGDQVIRLVAKCLRDATPSDHMVARYGGEEFAIVMPGSGLEQAVHLIDSVRKRIGCYDIVQQGTRRSLGRVTISAGVAVNTEAPTLDGLVGLADERLYAAKRAGRNRVKGSLSHNGEYERSF